MDKLSIFRLPILWMFLGPPAFRGNAERDAMASVEGQVDIWNIIRIVWWTIWGTVAAYELIRQREWVSRFINQLGILPVWISIWLGMIFISAATSPGFMFTLATATMFFMLLLAATDLGVKMYRGLISPRRLLRYLLFFSVALTALVWIVFQTNPSSSVIVGKTYTGIVRVRGEGIAYTPLLAQVIFLISLYFWLTSSKKWHLLLLGTMLLGLYFLYLGQTRSAYLSFVLALSLFVWHYMALKHNYTTLIPLAAAGIAFIATLIFLYGTSYRVTSRVDSFYRTFVLRDEFAIENEELAEESLMTLNGRTEAAAVVIDAALKNPLGLGYIAGLRTHMAKESVRDKLGTEAFHGAHNSYLEVLAGTGYFGFFGYLALILTVLWRVRKLTDLPSLTLRLLLYIVLIQGLFESSLGFAFRQSPVLFWTTIASLSAIYAYSREHSSQHVKTPA